MQTISTVVRDLFDKSILFYFKSDVFVLFGSLVDRPKQKCYSKNHNDSSNFPFYSFNTMHFVTADKCRLKYNLQATHTAPNTKEFPSTYNWPSNVFCFVLFN